MTFARSNVEKSFASGNKKTTYSKEKHEAKKVSEKEAYEHDLRVLNQNRHEALVNSSAAHKRTPPTSDSLVLALEGLDENRLKLSHAHLNAGREQKAYEAFIRSARTVKALTNAVVDCKIEDLEKYIHDDIPITEALVQYCLLCIETISNTEDPMHRKYLKILDLLLGNVDLEGKEPSVIIQKWRDFCPDAKDVQKILTTFLNWQDTLFIETFKDFKEAKEAEEAEEAYEGQLEQKQLQLQQLHQQLQLQQAEKPRGTMFPEEGRSRMITFQRELEDIVRGGGVS